MDVIHPKNALDQDLLTVALFTFQLCTGKRPENQDQILIPVFLTLIVPKVRSKDTWRNFPVIAMVMVTSLVLMSLPFKKLVHSTVTKDGSMRQVTSNDSWPWKDLLLEHPDMMTMVTKVQTVVQITFRKSRSSTKQD